MKTSSSGIDFIANHEGLRLVAYQDIAGYWTIGYGHKIVPGEDYLFGAPITQVQAKELLAGDLATAENAVNSDIYVDLEQNQFDALVSLVFNIGAGAFGGSTVRKRINDKDTEESIREAWLRWDKVTINGELTSSRGLARRRQDETDLFYTGLKKKIMWILGAVIVAVILVVVYRWM